jgi:pyruvate kinase
VESARRQGKPVVVATQMLESMIEAPTPTRAEVSDVANAVYDGADAVMLSAETAAGAWPEEAVAIMNRIAVQVESDPGYGARVHFIETLPDPTTSDALAQACASIAQTLPIAGIIVFTGSGSTARRVARERPGVPMLVLTLPSAPRARWACCGRPCRGHQGHRQLRGNDRQGQAHGPAPRFRVAGSKLVALAGVPFGTPGRPTCSMW